MTEKAGNTPACLNCGAPLGGQYCGQCGQRSTNRLISLFELIRDAFGDLFELDSRLWRTLIPLLIRPGQLTRDYLEGRRARYMPPFRMYLVLSLIFFVIAFFNPRDDFSILYEPETADQAEVEERTEQLDEAREELEGLVQEGVVAPEILEQEVFGEDYKPTGGFGFGSDFECDPTSFDMDAGEGAVGEWLARRITPERAVEICERWKVLGPQGFLSAVLDKTPAALILLLPIMALILKLLYPLSRRFYVEHLLYVVHFHSFFFLLLTLQILWGRLIAIAPLPEWIGILPIVATSFWVPVYLFLSMRRVYSQGRLATTLKFLLLSVTYLIGFMVVMAGALLMAAISV